MSYFFGAKYMVLPSSVSSSLGAVAAVTWEDMLKWKFGYLSTTRQMMIIKSLSRPQSNQYTVMHV
jgi:hypothetical protein